MQFGLKEPPSLTELWKENYNVSLSSLIRNGRTMTLDQYFDIRSNYKSSKDLDQLIKDRQTHLVYSLSDASNDDAGHNSSQSSSDQADQMDYLSRMEGVVGADLESELSDYSAE